MCILYLELQKLARKLVVFINDELDQEMNRYPEVDWDNAVCNLLREFIQRKEIAEMYNGPLERALSQVK